MENFEKYRKVDALNTSLLVDFIESPDHAKIERKPKSYFEDGKIYETMFEDFIGGSSHFKKKYFLTECEANMPENFISILENSKKIYATYGIEKFKEFMDTHYVYNKPKNPTKKQKDEGILDLPPELNSTKKSLHAWLDICKENPGLFPVSMSKANDIEIAINRTLNMVIEIKGVFSGTLQTLLTNEHSFQVPLYWEEYGIKKKALLDIIVIVNGFVLGLDLKYMADFSRFTRMFNSKYQWQSIHYCRGLMACYPKYREKIFPSLIFPVATKENPMISRPFFGDPNTLQNEENPNHSMINAYDVNCEACWEWMNSGKKSVGWKHIKMLRYRTKYYYD